MNRFAEGYAWARNRVKTETPIVEDGLLDGTINNNKVETDYSKMTTREKIRFNETGTSKGKYDTVGDIGDNAGLSIGAYQFTEKSGSATKLLNSLGIKRGNYKNDKEYKNAIKVAISSKQGIQAQEDLFHTMYEKSVLDYAKRKGITDQNTIDFLIDTKVNGGYLDIITKAKKNNNYTLEGYKKLRTDRYNRLVKSNPNNQQFAKGWADRVARF